ncbi:penicillin-binding protein 1A [Nitrosomonas sp. Nm33]|uniref:penicillin-binding protein 1A n=1 Tax=Nitrosomonas sp. Nm33 TaxID=133724 RepID=UPI000894666F|nr:penicillin-binding protein 1A [Nitrosomonas sp. Nm33]SDX95129.1 penicillin-binding protein 1A [Nitrosomonas sp. Nm33]
MLFRWLAYSFLAVLAASLIGVLLIVFAALVIIPTLPSLEVLTDYRPKIPLRIYSADGLLIGEFGEERRDFVKINETPVYLRQAILAAEDDRFYQHGGVDYIGILRAAYSNFSGGGALQGASTITMQVARNFFLTKEKTLTRKFSEALLSFKIEHSLSKDKILELYINQIYLGQRSYGFSAAAQTYFGKPLDEINLTEAAMLAGLPKAPSRFNPVVNLKRAKIRQRYVLKRMHELNYITSEQLAMAEKQPLSIHRQVRNFAMPAEYVVEMARQVMYQRFGEEAYTSGIKVYTTVRKSDQDAAYEALRKGILEYDNRHGYRGPEGFVELPRNDTNDTNLKKNLEEALQAFHDSNDILIAVVLSANLNSVKAYHKGGEVIQISGDGLKFAKRFLTDDPKIGNKRIRPGALIRIQKNEKNVWRIVQLPQIEAALVAIDPTDGMIRALAGGFDFNLNQFNHVTQAWRQPGSSFKPFIYSASLEKGFTPATIINDAPLFFDAAQTGSKSWEPKNFDGKFSGPIRMRTALTHSKNLVSIRILQSIGLRYAQDYITRFGFDSHRHPPFLPMALGAGSVTPLQMAVGYAAFANGGFRIHPYFIERIEDDEGRILEHAQPVVAGKSAKQVIDSRNAFLMTSMMQDVIQRGTATMAKRLGRNDIAGKTGTTSNFIDTWFCGFQKNLVTISWAGFDEPKTLGKNETGGRVALPIWINYMEKALKDVPVATYTPPPGITIARINPETGLREAGGAMTEYFFNEQLPPEADLPAEDFGSIEELLDQLF